MGPLGARDRVDVLDIDFWSHGSAHREDFFRLARDTVPVAFSEEPEIPGMTRRARASGR